MSAILSRFPGLLHTGHLVHIKKRVTLLNEGDICHKVFIIEDGSVRSWFNHDGCDVTFQFFFAGDIVTSYESLRQASPALYNIETITDCRLRVITRNELFALSDRDAEVKAAIDDYLTGRLYHYQSLFISRIKNNPQQRYDELVALQPDIFDRVPHHYIATYLGMTPVSLSRIRAKKRRDLNNC